MMSANSLTDSKGDRGMLKVMGMVLFSLFLFALFLFSMARLLGFAASDDADEDPLMRNALIGRIEPVGQVRTSADDLPHGEGVEVASAGGGAERGGEELVGGVCAGCHQAGAGGAPLLDDADAWAERREAGLDALVASVVNGKGSMPARGGSDYSDEEIRRAVQHMAMFEPTGEGDGEGDGEGGGEESAAASGEAAPDASGDAAEVAAAPEEDEGTAAANDMQAASDTAAGNDAAADGEAGGTVTERDVAGESSGEDGAAEEAVAADVGAEPGGDAPIELAALVASGEEPADMPEHVKGAVNGVCAGCHIAGVAGAPKIGDEEAWGARAETGLDALTQTVISGKGAMPARGGSQLTDEEIALAIQYLMGKQQ